MSQNIKVVLSCLLGTYRVLYYTQNFVHIIILIAKNSYMTLLLLLISILLKSLGCCVGDQVNLGSCYSTTYQLSDIGQVS